MNKQHAIYMRASTMRHNTASQEPELKRWAQSHEGDSCWYHDGYTGTSMDRPGFRKLVKDMQTAKGIPWSCGGWTGWDGRPRD